jgi:hypothetical protein
MKLRSVLSYLTVLSILFASILGCDKKEDTSPVEIDRPSESVVAAPEQSTSPHIEQFLKLSPSHVNVGAGTQISGIFEMWETMLHHKSMDIYFEVEPELKIQKDNVWKDKTYREILDELCEDNGLVWVITKPNTIRISKKTI